MKNLLSSLERCAGTYFECLDHVAKFATVLDILLSGTLIVCFVVTLIITSPIHLPLAIFGSFLRCYEEE